VAKLWLVVLTNPVEGREDEYNEWYSGRHLEDVLAVEGFQAAQRFEWVPSKLSRNAPFKYLAIYEVDEEARERAERALLETAGGPGMPISEAMENGRATWWFSSITDWVEAPAKAATGQ
jgi:hypothetical protein